MQRLPNFFLYIATFVRFEHLMYIKCLQNCRSNPCIETHLSQPKTSPAVLLQSSGHILRHCLCLTLLCCCLHRLAKTSRRHRAISPMPPSTMSAFLHLHFSSVITWHCVVFWMHQSCALMRCCCSQWSRVNPWVYCFVPRRPSQTLKTQRLSLLLRRHTLHMSRRWRYGW